MSLEEMRRHTPRQLFAMIDRLEVIDRPKGGMVEIMLAQVIAMIGNTSFREFKEPLQPKDFMPSIWAKKAAATGGVNQGKSPRKPRMTKKKQMTLAAQFRDTFMHFVAK
jgi:hypothetical protein